MDLGRLDGAVRSAKLSTSLWGGRRLLFYEGNLHTSDFARPGRRTVLATAR